MRLKKTFAALLIGTSLLSLCACNEETPSPPPAQDTPYVALQENVCDLYNAALQKIADSKSYTMTGSVTTVAQILPDGEMTTRVTPVELSAQGECFLVDSMRDTIDPHRTYFDGERYYFEDTTDKYFTATNDRSDYTATDCLVSVNSEVILEPKILENSDGSRTVCFKMPFNIYQSPALIGWLGIVFDDDYAANIINLTVEIDADGYIRYFLISYVNETTFGDEKIRQDISLSMTMTNYGTAAVTPPADLSIYEDWTQEAPPENTEPIGELSPEDLS